MLRKLATIFFALLIVPGILLAQAQSVKSVKKQIVNDNISVNSGDGVLSILPTTYPYVSPAVGDTVGITNYDYFSNSVIRDQIINYEGKTHMAPMIRPWGGVAARRVVTYIYHDGTNYVQVPVFDPAASSGWPHIDIALTGSAVGTLGVVGHVPNRLALWDGSSAFLVSTFENNSDPSLQFSGDVIWLACSGNRGQFQFYKTNDFGVSFVNWDSISGYSPLPIYWFENGGVEVGMSKSPDETHLVMFGTNAGIADGGAHVYNGVSKDSADQAWMIYSNNSGSSWTGKRIGSDGDFSAATGYHTANYAPLFENFGQLDMAVGNDGVYHAIANGYGLVFNAARDSAIADSYPVLYWNSNTNTWKSISSQAVDNISDTIMADKRPGNGIGQSYPGIAVSADGKVLFATWSGPEITNNVVQIDTSSNAFYNDIYYTYSVDGGATWTTPAVFAGKKKVSEAFGHPAQHLQDAGTNYVAHVLYMEDLVAGTSLFTGGGAASLNPLVYKTITVTKPSSVNDGLNPNSFALFQNYPNPFNPNTSISYTIPERNNVTLKIFDVLGREVKTLVNTNQEAGSYTVNFDASNLASGVYVYTLSAGNFVTSRKMMLMK